MSNARVIAKYSNRRLYDLTASRYITLADIRRLVLAGTEFSVTDRRTQKDITREVLLQVISEHEKGANPLLTQAFLCSVIRKQMSREDKPAAGTAHQSAEFDAPPPATDAMAADWLAA